MKKPVDPRAAQLKELRESVPRGAGGAFQKGNKAATGRRTANAEKMALLRATPANLTTEKMSNKFWLTLYVLAVGDLDSGTLPLEWAAKLVADKLWGNRHTISNDERMLKLEAELERIYRDNPKLQVLPEERVGPMKIAVVGG